uniref:Uncharacterized protein n=1 Tax=mine drainage metagenome TaxID=410659 RepID=E6QQ54_9ZZZZ
MEFISLLKAVGMIADTIKFEASTDSQSEFKDANFKKAFLDFWDEKKISRARSLSWAAMELNKAIHCADDMPLTWMEYDERKRFHVPSEGAREEGIRLLEDLTNWAGELQTRASGHVRSASVGYRVDMLDKGFFEVQHMPGALRLMLIGVDETALRELLEAEGLDATTPKVIAVPVTRQSSDEKPWLIAQTNDPVPDFPWYTAARYFARQLVKDDSTLLTKRPLLSQKVEQSLNAVGIKKRGGKKAPAATTILKAFVNVTLG